MKAFAILLGAAVFALAGCSDEAEPPGAASQPPAGTPTSQQPAVETPAPKKARGVRIVVGESQFGDMLFGPKRRAIYIFERDPRGETVCYGECARAWPPVLTDGEPVAGANVRASLLGTVKRRRGDVQVTYAGKPLYYYAHEGPGEVRCHNVNLNGGFWWVVGPDGARRP